MVARFLSYGRNTFASLSVKNYRLYFLGQMVSQSGTWMQTVALGWLALELTGSGTQLGFIVALQFLPLLFFGPWGGIIADRMDKRRLLLYTQIAFGLLAAGLGTIVFFGLEQVWMLYSFSLGLGIVRIFDNPARQSFALEMVSPEYLKNAVSLNSTSNNLARAVGPMVGGVLIAALGLAFCFLVNALSYVAVIVTLYLMEEEKLHRAELSMKRSGQISEGFRYVRGNPLIRDTLILMAVLGLFAYEFQVSLPLLAEVFGSGAAGYATLMAAFGLGSAIGGVFSAGRHTVAPHHLVLFTFLFGLTLVTTSWAADFPAAVFGIFLVGVFSINLTSVANTMIQLESVPLMRGRVMALWGMALIGTTPFGGPLIGWIGEYWGARWGIALGGVATLLALAVYSLTRQSDPEREITEEVFVEEERLASTKIE